MLYLGFFFFFFGLVLFFSRRSLLTMIFALEFLFISNILTFTHYSTFVTKDAGGIVFSLFILLVGASKAALALSFLIQFYHLNKDDLKEGLQIGELE